MNERDIANIFEQSAALMTGHFLLTSGLHAQHYFEKFALLQRPELTEIVCSQLAERFKDDKIDVVVGPAIGGILLAYEVARALGVRAIFTERVNGRMEFRRGFQIEPNENVLVVEDVVTTGGSVREVVDVVNGTEGRLAGVGVLVDRMETGADFGVRTESLYRLKAEAFNPEECPLCEQGVPLTKRGSRQTLKNDLVHASLKENHVPIVGVVLGSRSDLPVAEKGLDVLTKLGVDYELRIISAHRTPDTAIKYAKEADQKGIQVIIAGAGLAAHLAGVLAANTLLPVVGLPIGGGPLNGVDALYSTVQMPPGTPVATVGIDGGVNAALLAARIIGVSDQSIRQALNHEKLERASQVAADDSSISAGILKDPR